MIARAAVRDLAAAAAATPSFARLIDLLERLDRSRPSLLPVLTYHRIDEQAADGHSAIFSATPAEFATQVRWLASRRRPISLAHLLEVRRAAASLPPRSVMVTFDDGYRDFAEVAWPTLKEHGVPVTLFVPTAYPGAGQRAFWWDRLDAAFTTTARRDELETDLGRISLRSAADRRRSLRDVRGRIAAMPHAVALEQLDRLIQELGGVAADSPVLTWPELRALAHDGVAVAPHSRTHPLLDRIERGAAGREIAGSRHDLQREIGISPPAFAYPGGAHSPDVVALVTEAGFEVAFTTQRGINDLRRADWLRLRRINVGSRANVSLLRAQLLSWSRHLPQTNGARR
jgi:peptidoglycan/xylan/chitin deacetylase (PgdA/CDA1 family)